MLYVVSLYDIDILSLLLDRKLVRLQKNPLKEGCTKFCITVRLGLEALAEMIKLIVS